jgi:hypothetical protein
MGKRAIKREQRAERVTPAEAARDSQLRQRIRSEFPPASFPLGPDSSLIAALRSALQTNEKSLYQISREAGVSRIVVSRFLSGERDIRLTTADRLARVLGLSLSPGASK